jgi:hypothetical protein
MAKTGFAGIRFLRFRGIERRSERRRHVHDKNCVVSAVIQQKAERGRISRIVGVPGNIDRIGPRPDWRHCRIEFFHRLRRNRGEFAAEIDEAIHGEYAYSSAIGQDRKPLAGERRKPSQRFGGGEQFVEIDDAQQTGAAKRGVIDRVRSGERPGMG